MELNPQRANLILNPHSVERAVNEEHRNREEHNRENAAMLAALSAQGDRQFHRQQTEQRVNLMIGFSATDDWCP